MKPSAPLNTERLFDEKSQDMHVIAREDFETFAALVAAEVTSGDGQVFDDNPAAIAESVETAFLDATDPAHALSFDEIERLESVMSLGLFQQWERFFENHPAESLMLTTREFVPLPAGMEQSLSLEAFYFGQEHLVGQTPLEIDAETEECLIAEEPEECAPEEPGVCEESAAPQTTRLDLYRTYDDGLLGDAAIDLENATTPEVGAKAKESLRALEQSWLETYRRYADNLNYPDFMRSNLADFCDDAPWRLAGHPDLKAYFAGLSDADVRELYLMRTLAWFFERSGFTFRYNASFTDALFTREYDCNIIATLALHLLQTVGCESPTYVDMPHHVTLGYRTSTGDEIYFNNGAELLPPGYFSLPLQNGYGTRDKEFSAEPGQALGVLYSEQHNNNLPSDADWDDHDPRMVDESKERLAGFETQILLDPNYAYKHAAAGWYAAFLSRNEHLDETEREHYGQIAETHYRDALALNGSEPGFHLDYAELMSERGYLATATEHILKADELAPGCAKDLTKHIGRLRERLSLNPDNPETHYLLGVALRFTYAYDEAEAELRLALDADPAERLYQEALAQLFIDKAWQAYNGNDAAGALEFAEEAARFAPDFEPALLMRGWFAATLGDNVLTEESYAEAAILNPDSATALAFSAWLLVGQDPATAAELFASALALEPGNAEALRGMAALDELRGNDEKILGWVRADMERAPNDFVTLQNAAYAYALKGDFEAAWDYSGRAWQALLPYYGAIGPDGQYTGSFWDVPATRDLTVIGGQILLMEGDAIAAMKSFASVLESDPDHAGAKTLLAEAARAAGDAGAYAEALRRAEEAYDEGRLPPACEIVYFETRARAALDSGDTLTARVWIEKAGARVPDKTDVKVLAAIADLKDAVPGAEESEALAALDKLLSDHPRAFDAAKALAEHHEAGGDTDKSLGYYEIALGIQPQNPAVRERVEELRRECLGE